MSTVEEAQLLRAWRAGDKAAGSALVERHYAAIDRFLRNKVGEAADDLVQRTFLACVASKEPFRAEASVRTYLFTIARHELYAHFRARKRALGDPPWEQLSIERLVPDAAPSPSGVVAQREEQRLLLAGLRAIPLHAQILLELFYWEEMTSREISEVLELPHPTVRSRLRLARDALEAAMSAASRSPALLRSTADDLERWMASMRAQAVRPASDEG